MGALHPYVIPYLLLTLMAWYSETFIYLQTKDFFWNSRQNHMVERNIYQLSHFLSGWQQQSPRRSVKKLFLEISQNSQENTCARISISIKFRPATLLK